MFDLRGYHFVQAHNVTRVSAQSSTPKHSVCILNWEFAVQQKGSSDFPASVKALVCPPGKGTGVGVSNCSNRDSSCPKPELFLSQAWTLLVPGLALLHILVADFQQENPCESSTWLIGNKQQHPYVKLSSLEFTVPFCVLASVMRNDFPSYFALLGSWVFMDSVQDWFSGFQARLPYCMCKVQ